MGFDFFVRKLVLLSFTPATYEQPAEEESDEVEVLQEFSLEELYDLSDGVFDEDVPDPRLDKDAFILFVEEHYDSFQKEILSMDPDPTNEFDWVDLEGDDD